MTTLNEVAKVAGVTPMTVSRVINNPEKVKEETRKRVEKAMADLHYVPNVAARSLATNRSHIIDVYIPEYIDLVNPFSMYFVTGISRALSKHYYSFLILRNLNKEHECDGYIVTGLLKDEVERFKQYTDQRNREFLLFGHTEIEHVSCIDVDNAEGGRMATEHLIENGHKRIAIINVNENKDYTTDRFEGYCRALREAGIGFDEQLVISTENSVSGGTDAMRELLKKGGFTAVFCTTDTIALGAKTALLEVGLKVPDDISIIGFDGLGHNLLTTPHISTIRQPIEEIGEMMAEELIAKLNGKEAYGNRFIIPSLIRGETVKNLNK